MQATDVTASPQNTNAIRRRRSPRDASIIELCGRIKQIEEQFIRLVTQGAKSIAEEKAIRPALKRVQAAQNRLIDILIERPIYAIS